MSTFPSFLNNLLIATSASDQRFKRAVIYVCDHQEEGAVGIIINHPLQYHLDLIFDQLKVESYNKEQVERPLLFGGPMQPERGFVIHRPCGEWKTGIIMRDDVVITTSNDIIRAMAQDKGPKDVLITLGFTGWDAHQLEEEVKNNLWLVCPYRSELLYDVPFSERWEYAGSTLGVKMNQLMSIIGHA